MRSLVLPSMLLLTPTLSRIEVLLLLLLQRDPRLPAYAFFHLLSNAILTCRQHRKLKQKNRVARYAAPAGLEHRKEKKTITYYVEKKTATRLSAFRARFFSTTQV